MDHPKVIQVKMISKIIVLFVALSVCTLAIAAPQTQQKTEVVRQKNDNDGSGNYLAT